MGTELSSTLEDYLETIYCLERERRVARPRDISQSQGVARSTVTAALQSLSQKGLINYEPYELITLTEKGRKTAQRLDKRRRIMRDFLQNILGLEPERADETACGMEHVVEKDALDRFTCFIAFMRRDSSGTQSLGRFKEFMQNGVEEAECRACVENYVKQLESGAR